MIILRRTFTILLLLASQSFIFAGTTGKIAGYVKDQETGDPLIGWSCFRWNRGIFHFKCSSRIVYGKSDDDWLYSQGNHRCLCCH